MKTKRIGLLVHGVTLNVHCDHGPLLRRVAELLGDHVREPWKTADIEVEGHWLTCGPDHDIQAPLFDTSELEGFGKRMHIGADQLVWSDTHRDRNLQLRFRRLPSGATAFDVAYLYKPSTKKLQKYDDFEGKKYFDLTRYLVWFPLAWHLQRTRGWEMLHASAVSDGERCILIAGPGGAGKTTTCIGLMARAGMRLISENLVFTDGERVLPVPEPIRLTDESLALLGEASQLLQRFETRGGLKKKTMFVPTADGAPNGVRPALLFLPRFSPIGYARPIPPLVARDWVRASNTLTLELNDYYWYAAALELLWPGATRAGDGAVERLSLNTPCWSLGIDRSAGVAPVVDQILDCLNGRSPTTLEMNEIKSP